MHELAKRNPQELINILAGRLSFEQTNVKLYESLIKKLKQSKTPDAPRQVARLDEIRMQEQEHADWLADQIRALGGDAQRKSDMADLVDSEYAGIANVVLNGDPSVEHIFHAMQIVELADENGWQQLVELAEAADDDVARKAFLARMHEEEEHVDFIVRTAREFARREVLGSAAQATP